MSSKGMKIFSILAILICALCAVSAVSAEDVDVDTDGISDDVSAVSPDTNSVGVITMNKTTANSDDTSFTVKDTFTGDKGSASSAQIDNVSVSKPTNDGAAVSGSVVGMTYTGTDGSWNTNHKYIGVYDSYDFALANDLDTSVGVIDTSIDPGDVDTKTNGTGEYTFNLKDIISVENGKFTHDDFTFEDKTYYFAVVFGGLTHYAQGMANETDHNDTYYNAASNTYIVGLDVADKTTSMVNVTDDLNVSFNEPWEITGNLVDEDGNPIANAPIKVFLNNVSVGSVYTNVYGQYVVTNNSLANLLTVGNQTVSLRYEGKDGEYGLSSEDVIVSVAKSNASFEVSISNDTVTYPNTISEIVGQLVDANGNVSVSNEFDVFVNGNKVTTVTTDADGYIVLNTTDNPVAFNAIKDAVKNAGTYNITFVNKNTNINIDNATATFTVSKKDSSFSVNNTTISKDVISTTIPITVGLSGTDAGKLQYIVKNESGDVIINQTEDVTSADTSVVVDVSGITNLGNYTIDWVLTADNYQNSTASTVLLVRNTTVMTVSPTTLNYKINDTNKTVNVTLTDVSTENLNTTINVYVDDELVDSFTLVNGSYLYDVTDLELPKGIANVVFAYPGSDEYTAINVTLPVTVAGLDGSLNINETTVTVDISKNSPSITLNLTNNATSTTSDDLINYTGDVIVTSTGTGINDTINTTISMENGVAVVDIESLIGDTKVTNGTLTFEIPDYADDATINLVLNKVNPGINVLDNISVLTKEDLIIPINLTHLDATADYVAYLYDENGKLISAVVASDFNNDNNETSFNFGKQDAGNYSAVISVTDGVYTIDANKDVENITVTDGGLTNTHFIVDNQTFDQLSGKNFTATLVDEFGNPMAGAEVTLTLFNAAGESKTYYRTTNTEGIVKLAINLAQNGTYYIECNYPGDKEHNAAPAVNATVTIGSKVVTNDTYVMTAHDLNKTFDEAANFTATLTYASNGSAVVGYECKLVLKNYLNETKTYDRTTNNDGELKLGITLVPGTWTITAFYFNEDTNETSNNSTGTIIVTDAAP